MAPILSTPSVASRIAAPWHEGTIASLDFETTGVRPQKDRMVSVNLSFVDPEGEILDGSLYTIVNPGVDIPTEASEIHGITTAHAQAVGASPYLTLLDLKAAVAWAHTEGIPICIYNVPFDWPLLHAEAARHGVHGIPRDVPLLDPLVLDRALDRYRKGSRKLADVAAHYGVELADAHDASADAAASVGVLRALARTYPRLASMSLSELQGFQRRAYETWKDGINDYWERIGKESRVEGSWPGL